MNADVMVGLQNELDAWSASGRAQARDLGRSHAQLWAAATAATDDGKRLLVSAA